MTEQLPTRATNPDGSEFAEPTITDPYDHGEPVPSEAANMTVPGEVMKGSEEQATAPNTAEAAGAGNPQSVAAANARRRRATRDQGAPGEAEPNPTSEGKPETTPPDTAEAEPAGEAEPSTQEPNPDEGTEEGAEPKPDEPAATTEEGTSEEKPTTTEPEEGDGKKPDPDQKEKDSEKDKKIADLEGENQRLTDEVNDLHAKVEFLKDTVSALNEDVKALTEQNDRFQQTVTGLEAAVKSSHASNDSLRKEVGTLRVALTQLTAELQQARQAASAQASQQPAPTTNSGRNGSRNGNGGRNGASQADPREGGVEAFSQVRVAGEAAVQEMVAALAAQGVPAEKLQAIRPQLLNFVYEQAGQMSRLQADFTAMEARYQQELGAATANASRATQEVDALRLQLDELRQRLDEQTTQGPTPSVSGGSRGGSAPTQVITPVSPSVAPSPSTAPTPGEQRRLDADKRASAAGHETLSRKARVIGRDVLHVMGVAGSKVLPGNGRNTRGI